MEIQEISTSLLNCVRTDDVDGARRLLVGVDEKDRKSIVAKRDNSDPPLFVAAMRGNVDMVTYLVKECSADLEERGTFSNVYLTDLVTPLWCAVVSKKFETVKRLIELGADVNAVSDSGKNSVLEICVMTRVSRRFLANTNNIVKMDEDIVQLLIDHGSNPFMKNKSGNDVFHTASYKGHPSILEKLFLKFELQLPVSRAIDLYELIGSFYVDRSRYDIEKVLHYWKKAVEMRRIHSHFDGNALQPQPVCVVTKEVSTVEELVTRCHDLDFVYKNALMIRGKILGPHHYSVNRMLPQLLGRSKMHDRNGDFGRCIDILKNAFDLQNASVQRMPIHRINGWYWLSLYRLCLVLFKVHRECQQANWSSDVVIKFEDVFAVLLLTLTIVNVKSRRCDRNLSYG